MMYENIDFNSIDLTQEPPVSEPERQYYFIAKCRQYVKEQEELAGHPLTADVVTFGCQMNARDSEKLSGILEQVGYTLSDSEEADFVIYNTCTVRDNANQRVYGRLGFCNSMKRKNPHKKIALCGCMMQEQNVIDKLQKSYRFIDLIFGTHNIFKFAELLCRMFESSGMVIDIWKDSDQIVEDLPVERKYPFKSGINIMFGCNNFCTTVLFRMSADAKRADARRKFCRRSKSSQTTALWKLCCLVRMSTPTVKTWKMKFPLHSFCRK